MDLNLVVLAGAIAAKPEIQEFDSGTSLAKMLLAVRTEQPRRRIDVIPLVWWNPGLETMDTITTGTTVMVTGSIQRRFWSEAASRSRIEVVVSGITATEEERNEVEGTEN